MRVTIAIVLSALTFVGGHVYNGRFDRVAVFFAFALLGVAAGLCTTLAYDFQYMRISDWERLVYAGVVIVLPLAIWQCSLFISGLDAHRRARQAEAPGWLLRCVIVVAGLTGVTLQVVLMIAAGKELSRAVESPRHTGVERTKVSTPDPAVLALDRARLDAERKLEAVELLLDEGLTVEADALYGRINKVFHPARRLRLEGYKAALEGDCPAALDAFRKAEASGDTRCACMKDAYYAGCERPDQPVRGPA